METTGKAPVPEPQALPLLPPDKLPQVLVQVVPQKGLRTTPNTDA